MLAAIVASGALALFALVNRSYEKSVLAPIVGADAASALALLALAGAVLMGALLALGMRRS